MTTGTTTADGTGTAEAVKGLIPDGRALLDATRCPSEERKCTKMVYNAATGKARPVEEEIITEENVFIVRTRR